MQKIMDTRLHNVKKANTDLDGKEKLTDKLINELTVYYGLAILRSSHFKDEMKKSIRQHSTIKFRTMKSHNMKIVLPEKNS